MACQEELYSRPISLTTDGSPLFRMVFSKKNIDALQRVLEEKYHVSATTDQIVHHMSYQYDLIPRMDLMNSPLYFSQSACFTNEDIESMQKDFSVSKGTLLAWINFIGLLNWRVTSMILAEVKLATTREEDYLTDEGGRHCTAIGCGNTRSIDTGIFSTPFRGRRKDDGFRYDEGVFLQDFKMEFVGVGDIEQVGMDSSQWGTDLNPGYNMDQEGPAWPFHF